MPPRRTSSSRRQNSRPPFALRRVQNQIAPCYTLSASGISCRLRNVNACRKTSFADSQPRCAGRARLDHRAPRPADQGADRGRSAPALAVRRSRPRRNRLSRLSGRAADHVPQSALGGRAPAQTRRTPGRDRAEPEPHPPAVLRKRAPLRGRAEIGLAVGSVFDKHKMGKHFELIITDTSLVYRAPTRRSPPRPGSTAST